MTAENPADDAPDGSHGEPSDQPTTHHRDAIAEDARALMAELERVHPTPYRGRDGRLDLHRRLERTIQDLPESATTEQVYRELAPLVAGLEDGHSLLVPPELRDPTDLQRLPISVRVVGDQLRVEAVYEPSLDALLGRRIVEIEGLSVNTLADQAGRFRGAENRPAALAYLCQAVATVRPFARYLDVDGPIRDVTVGVGDPGDERTVSLAPVGRHHDAHRELRSTVERPSGSGPRFQLYEDGQAALFDPGALEGYREVVESVRHNDADIAEQVARQAHERLVKGETPADLDAVVEALPSVTETSIDLVEAMATANTEVLVVDLRNNPGGGSQYVDILTYALYGWEGVAEAAPAGAAVRRRSEPHRQHYGETGGSGTADDNPANYEFRGDHTGFDTDPATRLEHIRERMRRADTFARAADQGTHEGFYTPDQVIVVTTERTQSSGFAGVAQLSLLGADVVGVAPGQAPTSFGEPVERPLPNSDLTARITGAMFQWHPYVADDVLRPDRELTPALFDRYDHAGDAALRLAFDHAGVTNDGDPPTPD